MGFKEAIRTCVREKYITFSGRASRSEYWYFILFYFLVSVAFIALGVLLGGTSSVETGEMSTGLILTLALGTVVSLALFLPMIAVVVRRFHDRNLSGWWYLVSIIAGAVPFVGILASIAVFVITVLKGTDGENKFGPDPLVAQSGAEVFA